MVWSRIVMLLFFTSVAHAQTVNRYFVFFKDKNNSPYSISQPSQFLSAKSLQRRADFSITITTDDLPVNPGYVQQVRTAGAKTFFTSRWWNGVLVECEPSLLSALTALPFVQRVEFLAPGKKLTGARGKNLNGKNDTNATEAANDVQLQMMNLDEMHSEGYLGEGMNVAVFDSGFDGVNVSAPFQHIFQEGRLKAAFNFVHNNNDVFNFDDHGTIVFSVMAARSANYMGVVPKANYYLFKTEDVPSEYRIEEYNWTFAAERADSIGIDVINASLGYRDFDDPSMDYTAGQLDGKTAVVTRAARKAIERGIVVVVSAGNLGSSAWRLVTPPADAREVIAVGSITASGLRSSFSSQGATADGRIKPDVMALGSGTSVILPNGAIGSSSGTSLASPLVAGLAVGLRQKYPMLSVSELYQAIIRSSNQYATPDNLKGYGLPDFLVASRVVQGPPISDDIAFYPNPVSDNILKVVVKEPEGIATVLIHALNGGLMFENIIELNWRRNPFELDLSPYPVGTYLVTVKTKTFTKTQRIVRQ